MSCTAEFGSCQSTVVAASISFNWDLCAAHLAHQVQRCTCCTDLLNAWLLSGFPHMSCMSALQRRFALDWWCWGPFRRSIQPFHLHTWCAKRSAQLRWQGCTAYSADLQVQSCTVSDGDRDSGNALYTLGVLMALHIQLRTQTLVADFSDGALQLSWAGHDIHDTYFDIT